MKRTKLSILTLATASLCSAEDATVDWQYYFYQDRQLNPDNSRMQIDNATAMLQLPLADEWSAKAIVDLDTLSGASPIYLDTLSGASGIGIQDERWSSNLSITKKIENLEITVGSIYSIEEDYRSRGGNSQITIWDEEENSAISIGSSVASDEVYQSNNTEFSKNRSTASYNIGLFKNLSPTLRTQFNLNYISSRGYLSEPYKLSDIRPSNRDQYVTYLKVIKYLDAIDSAIHLSIRNYFDSWSVNSQTLEIQLYKELYDSWLIRPLFRFYNQEKAQFYNPIYPLEEERFNSFDSRLASMGSLSSGLRVEKNWNKNLNIFLSYECFYQKNSLHIGGKGSNMLSPLLGELFGMGITYKF